MPRRPKPAVTPTQELVDILMGHLRAAAEATALETATASARHALAVAEHLRVHVGTLDTVARVSRAAEDDDDEPTTEMLDRIESSLDRMTARVDKIAPQKTKE
ncbi:MAG: hypothetical protein JST00_30210 [Deltaproteobacteria bacterium]|nr:hypothetical protein [Deltaproteobacteria bacterium]